MSWIVAVAAGLALMVAGVVWYLNKPDPTVDNPIDVDRLRATLDSVGVALDLNDIPDPALLAPYISLDDTFVDAVPAQRGRKRALVVLLDDRIVAAEATVGEIGSKVHVLRLADVDAFDQGFEIGGDIIFETDGRELKFTHMPRSHTRDFAAAVESRLQQ